MAARPVINKGSRWQVGDGKSIKIWQHNWLPRESYFRVLSLMPENWDAEAMVDKLIVAELRQWNIGLLQDLFFLEEVEQIVRPPLSLRTVPDRRIWHYERHGKFSVRSAYHVARVIISAIGVGASFSASIFDDGQDKLWRKLWNACVPGKVKICVWRACIEALPTKSNLIKRKVIVDNFCVLCGSFGEST